MKPSCAIVGRAANGADMGVAVANLHQAAAAPAGGRALPEQAEIMGFFGDHDDPPIVTDTLGGFFRVCSTTQ